VSQQDQSPWKAPAPQWPIDQPASLYLNGPLPEEVPTLVRRGGWIVAIIETIAQVINLVFLAILYRLLGLEPYGLIAMVAPLLALARILISSGLDVATVQQQELSADQVSALFWIHQVLALMMGLVFVVLAPWVAWFYGVATLTPVTVALAGLPLTMTVGMQHTALLRRQLSLPTLALIRLIALVIAAASAVWVALAGWGVWALVLQLYLELLILAALAWVYEPWRPRLRLRGVGARQMIAFGGHCTVGNLMFFLITHFDKILVGHILGTTAVALFSQAFNLASKPVQLVLTQVSAFMMPALSRSKADPQKFAELLLGFFHFIGLTMFPMGLGLAIVAPEAIEVLGGSQWRAAGPILAILATTILSQGFVQSLGTVLAAIGRADLLSRAAVAMAILLCSMMVLGLALGSLWEEPLWGLAWAYTGTLGLVILPPYMAMVLRIAEISWIALLKTLWPPARSALAMAFIVLIVRVTILEKINLAAWGELLVQVGLGMICYLLFTQKELARLLGKRWE